MSNEEISEEEFKSYEQVRESGVTNMFDVLLCRFPSLWLRVVQSLSGLPREKIFIIMKKYEELMKKYPNVRKE